MINTPKNQEYRTRKKEKEVEKYKDSNKKSKEDYPIENDTVDLSLFRSSGHLNDIKIQKINTQEEDDSKSINDNKIDNNEEDVDENYNNFNVSNEKENKELV